MKLKTRFLISHPLSNPPTRTLVDSTQSDALQGKGALERCRPRIQCLVYDLEDYFEDEGEANAKRREPDSSCQLDDGERGTFDARRRSRAVGPSHLGVVACNGRFDAAAAGSM
jgi:hypothetical protein